MANRKSSTQAAPADAGKEHEALLLEAARVLPIVIQAQFQNTAGLPDRTLEKLRKEKWLEKLDLAIAKGLISDEHQQALWRRALTHPPQAEPMPPAAVTFGHSLFDGKHDRYGKVASKKRLGMVDLRVDWSYPASDHFTIHAYSDFSGLQPITGAGDVYSYNVLHMRMYALAFVPAVPLGKVMAQVEAADDWVRCDAKLRYKHFRPAVMVVTGREEIYKAITSTHDALLLSPNGFQFSLERAKALAGASHIRSQDEL